ncbi:MAG TPA: VOC family protein [Polyangiaceae bacterium]|nr:VOC family protein [Polyangiaceae bacterium]
MNSASTFDSVDFTGFHHLAFITSDLQATLRFYRDLLGLRLVLAMGADGVQHYFFELTPRDRIAFFAWDGASPMEPKRPGVPTRAPRGFDHLALGVATRDGLLAMRSRLDSAGVAVEGPIDHGLSWSIYFKDPNNIDLEIAWTSVALEEPLLCDPTAPPAALEGSEPRPEAWPTLKPAAAIASPKLGAGHALGAYVLERGIGQPVAAEQSAEGVVRSA